MEWIESLVLGIVQGFTEFLPVSSDGHLNITQKLFARFAGLSRPEAENIFFFVMLHVGTLAAIIIYYRSVWIPAARGLLGARDVATDLQRSAVIRVGLLAILATTPLVPLKLFFMKWIEQSFEGTVATGVGFLITAAVLLLTALLQSRPGTKGPAETTWLDALLIGIAQMFAPLPGVSRSGLTVATGLALGLSRTWAVGFSLLLAVPAICGAAVFELKHVDPKTLTGDRIAQTVAATAIAGIIGYAAIVWLVKIVRSGRMWYFSVYLILLALAVLAAAWSEGGSNDARHADTADGPLRGGFQVSPERDGPARPRPLARAVDAGEDPGLDTARAIDRHGSAPEGLLLGRHLDRDR